MNCEQAHELLGSAADNELANESAAMVAGHISKCAPCQEEWDQILAVRTGLNDILAANKASDDLEKRIISSLHKDQQANKVKYMNTFFIGAAAAVLVVSLAVYSSSFRKPEATLAVQTQKALQDTKKPASALVAAENLVASIGHHSSGPEDKSIDVDYVGKKDAAELAPKAGFAVQQIKLANYSLYGSDVVKTAQGNTLVRMCFNCTDGSSTDCIDCYQAPSGMLSFAKTSLRQVTLDNGQIAQVGQLGKQSAVLVSDKGTDTLFVTPLAADKLLKIVGPSA